MNNEEAIKIIETGKNFAYDEKYIEAFNRAIEVLKLQPCEDVISRTDLREEIFITAENDYQKGWNDALESVYKNAPSVQPKAKMGKWIWEIDETPSTPVSPYELNYAGWVCSCCHKFPDDIYVWDDPDESPTHKFCPNCGAKMVEPQESGDKE